MDIKELDSKPFTYVESDGTFTPIHKSTQKEFKERMTRGNKNSIFAGNMCIISIYQYWEDHDRKLIAESTNKSKNDVKGDIMGDIRLLRNSIMHHKAIALNEIKNCKIINYFKENDPIIFEREEILKLYKHIQKYLAELKTSNA